MYVVFLKIQNTIVYFIFCISNSNILYLYLKYFLHSTDYNNTGTTVLGPQNPAPGVRTSDGPAAIVISIIWTGTSTVEQ